VPHHENKPIKSYLDSALKGIIFPGNKPPIDELLQFDVVCGIAEIVQLSFVFNIATLF